MGRFAAIGGGTYEEIDPIAEKIVNMSGKAVPNVLFIGTALQDSTNPLTSCKKTFKRAAPGSIVKKLSVIRSVYTEEEIDALFDWADIIFAGGGNTAFMLEKWDEFGITDRLKKVFENDSAVLCGVSAGAICWFTSGYTDSAAFSGEDNWTYQTICPGIDLYDAFFCPHYNDYSRAGFDEEVKKSGKNAVALDDLAAFIYENGTVTWAAASESAHGYEFSCDGVKTKCI